MFLKSVDAKTIYYPCKFIAPDGQGKMNLLLDGTLVGYRDICGNNAVVPTNIRGFREIIGGVKKKFLALIGNNKILTKADESSDNFL